MVRPLQYDVAKCKNVIWKISDECITNNLGIIEVCIVSINSPDDFILVVHTCMIFVNLLQQVHY